MEIYTQPCEHRWMYYVNLATKAVRVRRCERCGARAEIAATAELATQGRPV